MRRLVLLLSLLAVLGLAAPPVAAAPPASAYQTGLVRWRAYDGDGAFEDWALEGVRQTTDGQLTLNAATAAWQEDPYGPGGYEGRSFYNGGSFLVGSATSPIVAAGFPVAEAIASWNAATPPGAWVEALVRARGGGGWTGWYNLGVWAADDSAVARHSVGNQGDADGRVAVDTLVLARPANALQLRLRLFSVTGEALPAVAATALAFSSALAPPTSLAPGDPARWGTRLALPACSQMVYPDGGEVWCSPTSLAMVLGYWQRGPQACEPAVRAAAAGTYDWVYGGHGNWPFNTAYAATAGLEAVVARFGSFAEAEPWIAAGVPVIISYAWGRGELTGAPAATSRGHLAVLAGFDARGNPLVHDPAAASDAQVPRVYERAQLERLWLSHSGGTVYLVFPQGWPTP
jgi:hypothetical protein